MRNFIKSFIKGVTIGVGLTFGLLTVFAAIVWPTTPTGEVDGGAFMNYFAKVMVNTGTTTNGVAKKAESLGLESGDTTVVSLNGANVGIGTTTAAQKLEVQGNLKVNGAIIDGTGTRMDSNGGWIRTYGPTGWYNNTYGGGWNMTDATRIRTYGSKSIYQNAGTLRTDGTLSVGVETAPTLYAVNGGNVGVGTNAPGAKFDVAGSVKLVSNNAGTVTIGSQNSTTEGAQINLSGAGTNDTWVQDVINQSLRLFTNSANTNTVSIFNNSTGVANLSVEGTVTAADPTASTHLATKAYVDSVVAAGGGSLGVYKGDGVTYLGKFVQLKNYYVDDAHPDEEQIVYVDASGNIQKISARDRMNANDYGEYYKDSNCTGTPYQIYSYYNGIQNYATLRSKADGLYYRHVTGVSCSTGGYGPIYRWDFNTSTCVLVSSYVNYCSYNTGNRYLKLCGQGDCKIK